jgi:hypothetical protein
MKMDEMDEMDKGWMKHSYPSNKNGIYGCIN